MHEAPTAVTSLGSASSGTCRVLALTGHPIEAAGARYRIIQFLPMLREMGLEVDHESFFTAKEYSELYGPAFGPKVRALVAGTVRRALHLYRAGQYDLLWIHLWLHPVTFPPFDMALRALDVPVVYDFDDAYYQVGTISDRLRDRNWAARLMQRSHTVVTGSDYIARVIQKYNPNVEVFPTAIDTDRFYPRDFQRERNTPPVIGWVGSHSTARYVAKLYPVIERLARTHEFVFRVIGAGQEPNLPGVRAEFLPWQLHREVDNFRLLDIGLYPLEDNELARGKHGFKVHQYMAVGVPAVASAVGLNPSMIRHGENGFLVKSENEWYDTLSLLLRDEALRHRVGLASREHVVREASVRSVGLRLVDVLRRAARRRELPQYG